MMPPVRFSLRNTLGTTMGTTLGLAVASFATLHALPASNERHQDSRPTAYVMAPDGTVYGWQADHGSLEPATLPWPRVAGLAQVEAAGTLVVLLPPPPEAEGRRSRRALGHVALLDTSRSFPTLRREVHIACEGRQVALGRGGEHAYVLGRTRPPSRSGPAAADAILEIDLETGRTLATAFLPEPSAGMALDPAGGRLYVSQPGRIATFTTLPLANSWLYRSPGENRALYVGRQGGVLAVLRDASVALFDPRALTDLSVEERRARTDDATVVLRLPFAPVGLALSGDSLDALAWRRGSRPVWIDLEAAAAAGQPEGLKVVPENASIQSLPGGEEAGSLHLALFPDLKVVTLPLPPPVARPEPAVTPGPAPTPGWRPAAPPPPPPRPPPRGAAGRPAAAAPTPGPPAPPPHLGRPRRRRSGRSSCGGGCTAASTGWR